MKDDPEYYREALGITRSIPSAETLRQRMDDIGSSLRQQILEANVDMFCAHDVAPTALSTGLVPVDIDVTPFDNSKSRKEGYPAHIKALTDMRPSWRISVQRDSSSIRSFARANSTASKGRRSF